MTKAKKSDGTVKIAAIGAAATVIAAAIAIVPKLQQHSAPPSGQPILVSVTVTFNTGSDDKDKDTKVNVALVGPNGTQIANVTNITGKFRENSSTNFALEISKPINKSEAVNATEHVNVETRGNDTWDFAQILTFRFSDGTTVEKHLDHIAMQGGHNPNLMFRLGDIK